MLSKKLLSAAKAVEPVYVEDVFQSWLRTGTGSSQTITTGVKENTGALVITKSRSAATNWAWYDTARGANKSLASNLTSAQTTETQGLTSFNADGHTWGTLSTVNTNGATYVDYVLKPQPKFFDVVTYTGDGTSNRPVAHSLASVPGCIIIKSMGTVTNWMVWHRSLSTDNLLTLNSTAAQANYATLTIHDVTSTNFQVDNYSMLNASGVQYVAYLFAHNAGGFGDDGLQNVISCGSFQGISAPTINLGWEPQFLLIKPIDYCGTAGDWFVIDNMRGARGVGVQLPRERFLNPNATYPESLDSGGTNPYGNCDSLNITATGFRAVGYPFNGVIDGGYRNYVYIAIRRGPMKTPTSGTSVFGLNARSGTGANATVTGGAGVTDLAIIKNRGASTNWVWTPRLAGTGYLSSNATTAETAAGTTILQANPWDVMDGVKVGTTSNLTNASGNTFANYLLDRAPGFFDVVCYTGTGVARTVNHNLGVAPELMIVKARSNAVEWAVGASFNGSSYLQGQLDKTNALGSASYSQFVYFGTAQPTSSVFSVGAVSQTNQSAITYVAYLFASCPGVSKVGSYTGNGSSQTINCGFTGGARFVLIKCTTAAESWHIFDTARGMVAGTDWRFRVNTTDQDLNNNWVYTATTGFELVTSDAAVNGTGQTYIFLAIA